ncbi:MAG: RHS repeat-associated core domain-containing protein, partial [Thermoplasmatota archaeon]
MEDSVNSMLYSYSFNGQNVLYEYGSNHPTVRYTHPLTCDGGVCGPTSDAFVDAPISATIDGEKYYYMYDGLGSVTELIDEDETVVNRYRYTVFGESMYKEEEVFNPYQYTGRRYDDETGQYYYRARMYSSVQSRFISNDPLGMVDGPN